MSILRTLAAVVGATALIVTGAITGASAGAVGLTPAAARSSATPPTCTGADLHVRKGMLEGAAGSRFQRVRVKNVSGHACLTMGLTRYRFRNATGPIGFRSDANPPSGPAGPIRLAAGQTARSVLSWTDPGPVPRSACRPRHATAFRLKINDVATFFRLPLDARVCTTLRYRPHGTRLTTR